MPKLIFQSLNDSQKGQLEYFLKILSEELSVAEEGGISISTSGKYETSTACIYQVLAKQLSGFSEFDENEMLCIVRNAILQCTREDDYTNAHFIEVLADHIKAAQAVPMKPYVLYTSISINVKHTIHAINTIRYRDAHLTFSMSPPKGFTFPERIEKLLEDNYMSVFPSNFNHLRVHIKARSSRKALDLALLRADEIRALWNLWLNYRGEGFYIGPRRPYNEIVYGPYHTLHLESGESAIKGYWTNETWCDSIRAYRFDPSIYGKLKQFERFARKALKNCVFRKDLETALILYVRSLDEPNPMTSLQKLWSVLETVTGKPRNNDEVIRRAIFHFIDRKYHKEQLDIIRGARNRLVHDGKEKDEQYALHFLRKLKMYVEHLLVFLLKHGNKFSGLDEFGWYLALPVDKQLVKRRISYMELAQEILGKEK